MIKRITGVPSSPWRIPNAPTVMREKLKVLVAYSMAHTHVLTTYDYLKAFSFFLDADVQYLHVTVWRVD